MSARIAIIACAALAGCSMSPAENRRVELRQRLFTYDDAYASCLYRVTGPFSGASLDVMRECDRQARIVANLDDPTAARAELAR